MTRTGFKITIYNINTKENETHYAFDVQSIIKWLEQVAYGVSERYKLVNIEKVNVNVKEK